MQELSNKAKIQNRQPKAGLVEIFSSYQGEGLFIGAKQIFIRFAGCNLNCSFCDTLKDAVLKDVTVAQVVKKIKELEKAFGLHHSVSLTGGEPLLHVDFLERLLPKLKKENFKTYLETNGTLSKELKRVIEYIDIIAMDVKLPSSTGMPPSWQNHIEFLKIATNPAHLTRRKRDIFIKAVVTDDTSERDIIKARDIVARFDKNMLFVLQPASPTEKGDFMVKREKLWDYRHLSEERLNSVRIVPQLHKFLGIK